MRTPTGNECPYYYEDFHRGRSQQECRLISNSPNQPIYTPDLCTRCRVPRILMANACPHMVLEAQVVSGFLGLRKRVEVSATCTRSLETVEVPEIGCGQCHLDFPSFATSKEEK